MTLPAAPTTYRRYIVKDRTGNATTNNITVNGNGKNIDNAATKVISGNFGSTQLLYNGTSWEVF